MRDDGDQLRSALEGSRGAIEAGIASAQTELDDLRERSRQLEDLISRARAALGESSLKQLTLHDALAVVLRGNGNRLTSAKELSSEVTRRGLYSKRDGTPLEVNQVHARTNNYPHLFEKQDGLIRLKKEDEPMT
jgi:hypothetical protein